MEKHNRELKRGTLEMLLLRVLSEGSTYGYELVTRLNERSQGVFGIKEGTLYPVLYRLEDAGLIEPEWNQRARGVPRKYYQLTAAGTERLHELEAAWTEFSTAVDAVLSGSRKEKS